MTTAPIAITGIGVIAPNGTGREAFWESCRLEVSGIKRITLFETSEFRCRWAGEVTGFEPEALLGAKGLRNLDRTTLLAMAAAKLAIDDAKFEVTPDNCHDTGVVLGSTMGSVKSISDFDIQGLREGPRSVNPALFPNTVINSPASHVAIRFGLKGLNSTISTGFTASHDALGYAMDMLRLGRVKTLLVGGVEELCLQTFIGFYKVGMLARRPAGSGEPSTLDDLRQGTLLGEGAAFLVLESVEDAQARGANVLGQLLGYGSLFHPAGFRKYDPDATGLAMAIREALSQAGVEPEDVGDVSGSANGIRRWRDSERAGVGAVLGERPVHSVKRLIGESFSAGGALQLAASIGAGSRRMALAHAGGAEPGDSGAQDKTAQLTVGMGPTGVSSAVVWR